jgi:hypothetical protein
MTARENGCKDLIETPLNNKRHLYAEFNYRFYGYILARKYTSPRGGVNNSRMLKLLKGSRQLSWKRANSTKIDGAALNILSPMGCLARYYVLIKVL